MTVEALPALGVAATLVVAAIAVLRWLINFAIDLDTKQTAFRHDLRNEIGTLIAQSEERLTHRLERLEEHSIGLQQWAAGQRRGGPHERDRVR